MFLLISFIGSSVGGGVSLLEFMIAFWKPTEFTDTLMEETVQEMRELPRKRMPEICRERVFIEHSAEF